MFSRNSERAANDDRRTTVTPSGVRDVSSTTPVAPSAIPPDLTVVARADRLEGTLKIADMLRVFGTLEGSVEATVLHIEEGATVRADIAADEVVIGGDYSGNLLCRQRLEVRASGRVSGHIETFRLMLHEGASVDGELRMLKQPGSAGDMPRSTATIRAGSPDVGIRSATGPSSSAPGAPSPAPIAGLHVAAAKLPPGAEPIG
jgi:cytoskeletal protein CcmA (bactofilin family)